MIFKHFCAGGNMQRKNPNHEANLQLGGKIETALLTGSSQTHITSNADIKQLTAVFHDDKNIPLAAIEANKTISASTVAPAPPSPVLSSGMQIGGDSKHLNVQQGNAFNYNQCIFNGMPLMQMPIAASKNNSLGIKQEVTDQKSLIDTKSNSPMRPATASDVDVFPLTLAIGESDFKSMVEQKALLVDKSLFIKEIIDDKAKVKLILRPRRFGKSLNMSMLRYFFEKSDEKHDALFSDKAIWKAGERYQREQGQYPVLFITLKEIKANQFKKAEEGIREVISTLFKDYKKLLFSSVLKDDTDEQKDYQKIIDGEASATKTENALKKLTGYLHKAYGKQVIVLIDEYDTPINASYEHQYYPQMIDLMRSILSPLLKDNSHLHQAVLTGILRVAKESIFSGLNNTVIYSVLADAYASHFGFTLTEITSLLGNKVTKNLLSALEDWYGGYQINQQTIYNPWSMVSFIEKNRQRVTNNEKFERHWVNTSENAILMSILSKLQAQVQTQVKSDFKRLLSNQPIARVINEHTVFNELDKKPEAFWSFLLLSGYLAIKPGQQKSNDEKNELLLVIPNKDVYGFYEELAKEWFKDEKLDFTFKNLAKTNRLSEYQERYKNLTSLKVKAWCLRMLFDLGDTDLATF